MPSAQQPSDLALAPGEMEVGDYWEWDELCRARGWTDGLPVAPPTTERVDAIIAYLGMDPNLSLGLVGPANGKATVEQVAIQCAMAGCRPEHVPVVLAALDAMLDPAFSVGAVQATTNPCSPLAIVCGPIVEELDFNTGDGVFGGGGWANAAIGRAIRLILWNIGGGRPGTTDKSPLGQPAKYAFCIGEGQHEGGWTSLASDFGYEPSENCVITFACHSPYPMALPGSPRRMLAILAESAPSSGLIQFHAAGQILFVFSPRVAETLAGSYTREEVRQYLFDHARFNLGDLRRRGIVEADDQPEDPASNYWGSEVLDSVRPNTRELPDDAWLPLVESIADLHVIVTGGRGQFLGGICPGWGGYGGYATARPIVVPTA
jgi:hypothetical protein